jgi:hypothetical protein
MRKIATMSLPIVVMIAAVMSLLAFRSHESDILLNVLHIREQYFTDKDILNLAENKSNDIIPFPIAYLAFMRTTFENQEKLFNTYKPYLRAGDYISTISISPPQSCSELGATSLFK